jgi:glutamate-1-semialdehyde aminotransferase
VLQTIAERGRRLMSGLQEIFEENDVPVVMSGYPSMFSFAFGVEAVTCQRDWSKSDQELYLRLA